MLNPDLQRLKPYPFEQLSGLLLGIQPPAGGHTDSVINRGTPACTTSVCA